MKKQSLRYTILGLFISAVLAQGCQKAPAKKVSAQADEAAPAIEKLAIAVCSDDLMAKRKTFQLAEIQTLALHDKMSLQNSAEHQQNYRKLAQKQVENCKAILDQFEKEKISACFKTAGDKSQENSFSKDVLEKKCKTLGDWGKTVTRDDNTFTEVVKPKVIAIKLGSTAQKLIQPKTASEFLYLVKSEIKAGKEQYQKDAQAGLITCTLSSQSNEISEASVLKYVAESVATKTDVGFELKQKSSLITLQDSGSTVVSLLCLNLEISSEVERASSLKKIFGHQALIQEYDKDDARLNADLAPPVAKADDKVATTEKAVAEAEKSKAIDQTIDKARSTMQGVLKETLEEIKKTSLEISEGSIAKAQVAANEVIGTSITKAETAAINIVKASETTGVNLIQAAELSAARVVEHSVQTATVAAEKVSEKTILQTTVAGKELIQESKVAATEVVDQSITKAKTAALDTVKAPFKWIGEKATNAWEGFTGFFSSSTKKDATIDIRKKIRD